MVVGEEVSCQVLPWGIWHISRDHSLDCLLGLMLGTNLASINIINNVHIYSGPVDSGWVRCFTSFCFLCGCCGDH